MAKAKYTTPATQDDLAERQKNGNENSSLILSTYGEQDTASDDGRDFSIEGNQTEGYLGVDPTYQNYASQTEKPLRAEGGPEKKVEDEVYGNKDGNSEDEETEVTDPDPNGSDDPDQKADDKGDKDDKSNSAPNLISTSNTK